MNDSVGLSTDRPRLCGRPGVGTSVHTCVGDGVRTGVGTLFFLLACRGCVHCRILLPILFGGVNVLLQIERYLTRMKVVYRLTRD